MWDDEDEQDVDTVEIEAAALHWTDGPIIALEAASAVAAVFAFSLERMSQMLQMHYLHSRQARESKQAERDMRRALAGLTAER